VEEVKENAVEEKDTDQPPKKKRKKDVNKENHSKVKSNLVSLMFTLLVKSLRRLFNNFNNIQAKIVCMFSSDLNNIPVRA
jgi:hypothetical protein